MQRGLFTAIIAVVGILLFVPMASAASINFTATDPSEITAADYDIVSFGASENGDKITFWLQVRGNINTQPPAGYMNGYQITIEGIEMTALWVNGSSGITQLIYLSTEDNSMSYLTPDEYIINGGKLEFHLSADIFSNIGDDYTVNVYTAHIHGDNAGYMASHLDEATYSSYGSSGSGSGNGGSGPQNGGTTSGPSAAPDMMGLLTWVIIGTIIAVVIVAVVLIIALRPKNQKPPNPPQPP